MGKALENPERPFVAILGGSKVSDKIGVINNLLEKVDTLIIGGGMAFTFLKAQGYEIGKSLLEEDKMELAMSWSPKPKQGVNLLLPVDVVAAEAFAADAPFVVVTSRHPWSARWDWIIGPVTAANPLPKPSDAKPIWNCPDVLKWRPCQRY